MRRVVVTGISVVSPLGCEISEFWDRLCTGKSVIVPLRRFDVDGFKVRFGGEIFDFDPVRVKFDDLDRFGIDFHVSLSATRIPPGRLRRHRDKY